MYRSYRFLAKVKASTTGKVLASLPRTMRWLNCAIVNSIRLTAVIRNEKKNQNHRYNNMIKKTDVLIVKL
jgi:uncharacterized protein with PhoU and TrkA domain